MMKRFVPGVLCFLMEKMIKKIGFGLLFLATLSCTAKERGFFDFMASVADGIYVADYTNNVVDTGYLFDSIIDETRLFNRLFSPAHDMQLADMYRILLAMRYEWAPFLREHEHVYGLSLSTIKNLNGTLHAMLDAMRYTRVSLRPVYDADLHRILDYLEQALYEMRSSVMYLDSIDRIEGCLDRVVYVIRHLR